MKYYLVHIFIESTNTQNFLSVCRLDKISCEKAHIDLLIFSYFSVSNGTLGTQIVPGHYGNIRWHWVNLETFFSVIISIRLLHSFSRYFQLLILYHKIFPNPFVIICRQFIIKLFSLLFRMFKHYLLT